LSIEVVVWPIEALPGNQPASANQGLIRGMDSLPGVPGCDRLRFLRGERREDQVGIGRLPGEGLGFVEGKAKKVILCAQGLAEFGQDGVLGLLNLGDEFLAGRQAGLREGGARGAIIFGQMNRIHGFVQFE